MLDIISIGTVAADIFIQAPTSKRSRAGSKIDIPAPCITVGGGAHNSAVTFARRGLRAGLLARIGADVFGEEVKKGILNEGIAPHLVTDRSGRTGVSFILLQTTGERTILVHRGISGAFTKKEFLYAPQAAWAHISPGSIPLPILMELVRALHARGTRIAINPSLDMLSYGLANIRPILNRSSVVLLNREEASVLTRVSYAKKNEIFRKLDVDVLGIAIMTDGAHGAFVSDGKTILEEKALRVKKVVDMTGAGDAFGSAFVAALIEKGEQCDKNTCKPAHLSYALRKGSQNAAFVIQYIGGTEGIRAK